MVRTRPPQGKKSKSRRRRTTEPLNSVPVSRVQRSGPKSVYDPNFTPQEAEELVGKLGARQKELAEYFEVSVKTIEYWTRQYPEFARHIRRGRVTAALRVSQALYHRAIGYDHPDIHILSKTVKVYDKEGKHIETITEPVIVPITKHYPPDAYAANKYLSIMFRDVWADITKMSVDHSVSGEINVRKIEELSLDDLSDSVKDMLFELNMKQLSDAQQN